MFRIRWLFAAQRRERENGNLFFLYGHDEILKVLNEINGLHKVISLYFPDLPGDGYATSLSKVGNEEFLFDRVACDEGHALVLKRKSFRALSKYRGVTITFDCQLNHVGSRWEKIGYRVAFPWRVYYPQKKGFFPGTGFLVEQNPAH